MKKFLLLLVALVTMAACTEPPSAISHRHVTEDGLHMAEQISMNPGRPGAPNQTAMVVYSKYSKTPIAVLQSNTQRTSDRMLDLAFGTVPAVIQGEYHKEAARINCPPGTLCGTYVDVDTFAGANAGAQAAASRTDN